MQNYTGVVVRGEYDNSSILASYDWETGESTTDFIQGMVDPAPETTLIVPESIAPVPAVIPESSPATPPEDPKRSLYVTHTVSRGDTLSTIAQRYDIPVATPRTMN